MQRIVHRSDALASKGCARAVRACPRQRRDCYPEKAPQFYMDYME